MESENAMDKVRYTVKRDEEGIWYVEWKKGILTTIATFPTFTDAHDYVRYHIYGTQSDYGYAC